MKSAIRICVVFALAAGAAGAAAQSPHPADPAAVVPQPAAGSMFPEYRPYRDEKLAPWREVNDEVARVGGHMGVLRSGKPGAMPPAAAREAPK